MVVRRILLRLAAILYFVGCACLLLFPSVRTYSVADKATVALVPFVSGVSNGKITLVREGVFEETPLSAEGAKAADILEHGTLPELLELDTSALPRLDRVALYREYGKKVYLDNGYFEYTGKTVERTSAFCADEGILLGVLNTGARETKITTLVLTAGATFTPQNLAGSSVVEVIASAPYAVQEGAITLQTQTGVRLFAGLPNAKRICVSAVDYCDEGALLASSRVEELMLPFLGARESDFGRLGYLFGKDGIPKTLKRVTVTGGGISSDSFYGCEGLEEIDLCKIPSQNIAYNAFENLPALTRLHCARKDVTLSKGFTASVAPCGCTVYIRKGEIS